MIHVALYFPLFPSYRTMPLKIIIKMNETNKWMKSNSFPALSPQTSLCPTSRWPGWPCSATRLRDPSPWTWQVLSLCCSLYSSVAGFWMRHRAVDRPITSNIVTQISDLPWRKASHPTVLHFMCRESERETAVGVSELQSVCLVGCIDIFPWVEAKTTCGWRERGGCMLMYVCAWISVLHPVTKGLSHLLARTKLAE